MKNVDSNIITALSSNSFSTFVLVDIAFTTLPLRLTSLGYDVTVGGNTYVSDGGLLEVAPPSISSTVDREAYSIRIADNSNVLKARWDAGASTGVPVTVRMGVNDDITSLDIAYRGRIDAVRQEVDFRGNEKASVIECSSPFADLDLVNSRLTSDHHQEQFDSTDTCFSNITSGALDEIEFQWGKAGSVSTRRNNNGGGNLVGSVGL